MAYFYKKKTLKILAIAAIILSGWLFASATIAAVCSVPTQGVEAAVAAK